MPPSQISDSTRDQILSCMIDPDTFFCQVMESLERGLPLSVVRMGDGDRAVYLNAKQGRHDDCLDCYDQPWRVRLGCERLPKHEALRRLTEAATTCSHFAPSTTGLADEEYNVYDLFPRRSFYVDNFFCELWTKPIIRALFVKARTVLLIHRAASLAIGMNREASRWCAAAVHHLALDRWQQTENIICAAHRDESPLVLFSAGPAGKYIGPIIANYGSRPKVVLDIGNAAKDWVHMGPTEIVG